MPKNKGKGGKARRRGKGDAGGEDDLPLAEEGQSYGKVTRILGGNRVQVACVDGRTRQACIRGAMHKKVWVAAGDAILVSLRDYQDDVADVIYKYSPAAARQLKALGELPDSFVVGEPSSAAGAGEEEAGGFEFSAEGEEAGPAPTEGKDKDKDKEELDVDAI